MTTDAPPRPARPARARRYPAFVNVFVPFALLLAAGNLFAEAGMNPVPELLGADRTLAEHLTGNPTFAKVMYSIWLTLVFAIPAVGLFLAYDLRTAPPPVYRYWQLFWTFGFVAYAIHAYYATAAWFGWDFAQIIDRQSLPVVVTNYAVLLLWGVDVAVSLVGGQGAGGVTFYRFQWLTHLLFVVAAVVAAVVFYFFGTTPKTVLSLLLGVVLAICVASFGAYRLIRCCRTRGAGP